jgi:hypothetical protein
MKTSVATTVSFVAVLAAGGLAFAVNTRALTDTSVVDGSVPAFALVATASKSTNATLPAPSTTTSTAQLMVAGTSSAETSEYEIAGIGVIVVQKDGESLKVMNVNPSAGFTYSSLQKSSDQVQVDLASATQIVEFRARLLDGRIINDVQVKNILGAGKSRSGEGENDDDDDHKSFDKKSNDKHEQNEKNKGEDDDD